MDIWAYGLFHVFVLSASWYTLGWLYGSAALIAMVFVIDFIMDKLGYVRMGFGDIAMSLEKEGTNYNIRGYFEIEKFNYDEFNKIFYERAVLQLRKLRQIRKRILGVYYWKDVDANLAKQQIIKCKEKLTNENQVRD